MYRLPGELPNKDKEQLLLEDKLYNLCKPIYSIELNTTKIEEDYRNLYEQWCNLEHRRIQVR